MPTLGMEIDISSLVEATVAGDRDQLVASARSYLQRGAPTAELVGRIGLRVARGDSDGHAILILGAVAALSRFVSTLPQLEGQGALAHVAELPLLVRALVATAPALRAGESSRGSYPEPLFPSGLPEGEIVDEAMHAAVYNDDGTTVERLLFGLYGTGADYRTMEVRTYDGIATTFQNAGHPLIFAVRGFQLLDIDEWGDRAPAILHWLAPHLPLHSAEPAWINEVRAFLADPAHRLESLRTRLSAPQNEHALPLRQLILSNASTSQICQGVFDALMKGGASTRGVGSVIALAAADALQRTGDAEREAFVQASHGLLFAASVRMVYARVQDIAAVPLLFTSAAYINSLQKELVQEQGAEGQVLPATFGGGLIASSLLETLKAQLDAQDLNGAFSTARRYTRFERDSRPLWATIGLSAARADAEADLGHTLQIIQACSEEYQAWPVELADINVDIFLQVALRAAAFARRNTLVEGL
jgi:sirohydrochlorin ferrochelatase